MLLFVCVCVFLYFLTFTIHLIRTVFAASLFDIYIFVQCKMVDAVRYYCFMPPLRYNIEKEKLCDYAFDFISIHFFLSLSFCFFSLLPFALKRLFRN